MAGGEQPTILKRFETALIARLGLNQSRIEKERRWNDRHAGYESEAGPEVASPYQFTILRAKQSEEDARKNPTFVIRIKDATTDEFLGTATDSKRRVPTEDATKVRRQFKLKTEDEEAGFLLKQHGLIVVDRMRFFSLNLSGFRFNKLYEAAAASGTFAIPEYQQQVLPSPYDERLSWPSRREQDATVAKPVPVTNSGGGAVQPQPLSTIQPAQASAVAIQEPKPVKPPATVAVLPEKVHQAGDYEDDASADESDDEFASTVPDAMARGFEVPWTLGGLVGDIQARNDKFERLFIDTKKYIKQLAKRYNVPGMDLLVNRVGQLCKREYEGFSKAQKLVAIAPVVGLLAFVDPQRKKHVEVIAGARQVAEWAQTEEAREIDGVEAAIAVQPELMGLANKVPESIYLTLYSVTNEVLDAYSQSRGCSGPSQEGLRADEIQSLRQRMSFCEQKPEDNLRRFIVLAAKVKAVKESTAYHQNNKLLHRMFGTQSEFLKALNIQGEIESLIASAEKIPGFAVYYRLAKVESALLRYKNKSRASRLNQVETQLKALNDLQVELFTKPAEELTDAVKAFFSDLEQLYVGVRKAHGSDDWTSCRMLAELREAVGYNDDGKLAEIDAETLAQTRASMLIAPACA